jgi:hypothetical protein
LAQLVVKLSETVLLDAVGRDELDSGRRLDLADRPRRDEVVVLAPMHDESTSRVCSDVFVIDRRVDIHPRLVIVRRTDEPATIRTADCHGRIVEPTPRGFSERRGRTQRRVDAGD